MLRLRAEMKLPGQAWLQYEIKPWAEDQILLVQTAFFAPHGLLGFLYWYALYPIHVLIFSGTIRNLSNMAIASEVTTGTQEASCSVPVGD